MTPEERRDAAVAVVISAGGTVNGAQPLARPETPHVIAMYQILPGPPVGAMKYRRPEYDAAIESIERSTDGFVNWTPEEVEDAPLDESG